MCAAIHTPPRTTRESSGSALLVLGVLILFFFQLLADFVEAVYASGLMITRVPGSVLLLALLGSPFLLTAFRKGPPRALLPALAALVVVTRLAEVALHPPAKTLAAGLGAGSFLVLFPLLLRTPRLRGQTFGKALGLAWGMSILLRTLGSSVDFSSVGDGRIVGVLLAAGVVALWCRVFPGGAGTTEAVHSTDARGAPLARSTVGPALGIGAAVVLLYFAFTSPAVLARWTRDDYGLIVAILITAVGAVLLLLDRGWSDRILRSRWVLPAANLLFALSLEWTVLSHYVVFPAAPGAYPLAEPTPAPFHRVLLLFALILSPALIVDFMIFAREVAARRPSLRALGVAFGLASGFLIVMVCAQVFTTVYDYVPIVGPFFRDKLWLVYLLPGAILCALLPPGRRPRLGVSDLPAEGPDIRPVLMLLVVTTVVAAGVARARPVAPGDGPPGLKVLTYNVQQGYSADGRWNYAGQGARLAELNADVIGLQESDTARVAGGNSDLVRYFADRLNLYAYSGPKTGAGTFGIALLSRYPIRNPQTYYLQSRGEQTATITAEVAVRGRVFTIFVTHLGNGGPRVQQEQVLQLVQGRTNVILVGDFNFRPDSEQYRLTTALLEDAWRPVGPRPAQAQGLRSDDRIDHTFVSPGTRVLSCDYVPGPQSDHPAMVTRIGW